MCAICKFLYCPSSCPSYEGDSPERGRPIGECAVCEDYIYEDDYYYIESGKMLCAECAEDYE